MTRIWRHVPRPERWTTLDARCVRSIPEPARQWVTLGTSLTAALATHLGEEVKVRVLSERHGRFFANERDLLGTLARAGRIREVQLEVRGVPYIVARTVFPHGTARGANRTLLHLGTRALGSLLFGAMSAPTTVRQYIELRPQSSLWGALHDHLPREADRLWARRALHLLQGRPLLVTEVFLPTLWQADPAEAARAHIHRRRAVDGRFAF
jgi:chorismate--pyruvate lyase